MYIQLIFKQILRAKFNIKGWKVTLSVIETNIKTHVRYEVVKVKIVIEFPTILVGSV